jgi:hypothetical protein
MPRFYKGVGVGTYLHGIDLQVRGIAPRAPGTPYSVDAVMEHIARATTVSPCISLTRSYGVAEDYARHASRLFPTASSPAFVYEIDISDPPPSGVSVIDPVFEVMRPFSSPLGILSYHHDGDMNFLLGVVDPVHMGSYVSSPIRTPPGSVPTPRAANLTIVLEAVVRSLRDSEVIVVGSLPGACVIARYDVF